MTLISRHWARRYRITIIGIFLTITIIVWECVKYDLKPVLEFMGKWLNLSLPPDTLVELLERSIEYIQYWLQLICQPHSSISNSSYFLFHILIRQSFRLKTFWKLSAAANQCTIRYIDLQISNLRHLLFTRQLNIHKNIIYWQIQNKAYWEQTIYKILLFFIWIIQKAMKYVQLKSSNNTLI
jgi:hypothetical protein